MAKRIQFCGKKYIEGDGTLGWERSEDGRYVTEMFGVTYQLEKRTKNVKDETYDAGWYLYSKGAADGLDFFGEFCGKTLMGSVDTATTEVLKADLRGEGHGPKVQDANEVTVSSESALNAARVALADLKATDWTANPAYWVGRLEVALTGALRAVDGQTAH